MLVIKTYIICLGDLLSAKCAAIIHKATKDNK